MAQRLQIFPIICAMFADRNDMIDIGCWRWSSVNSKRISAQWMLSQKYQPQPPPPGIIATRSGATPALIQLMPDISLMPITVSSAIAAHDFWATALCTRPWGFLWHDCPSTNLRSPISQGLMLTGPTVPSPTTITALALVHSATRRRGDICKYVVDQLRPTANE